MLGQGLNLGIQDAQDLTECITANLEYGLALNDGREIQKFEQKTRWRNYRLQTAVEAVKLGYGAESVGPLRDLVIRGLDANQSVKSILEEIIN